MITCKEITQEENIRLNGYINALTGTPKLVDCEKLFEYLRVLRANYEKSVVKAVNKINIQILRPAITFIWTNKRFSLDYRNRALDLSKKSLLFSAREDFDSFMLYTEIERRSEDKFWQPRRSSKMKLALQGLQELADDKIDVLFMAMPPRVGKLIADYEPVLTRNGWKNHGDLVVGDEVVNPYGYFVKVTHIHPKNLANMRVEFSNHQTIDCHENHEWVLYDRNARRKRIVETKEMIGNLFTGEYKKRGCRFRFQLPQKGFMMGDHKELPVKPYTLGAWLGDGKTTAASIANPQEDFVIVENILKDGYEISWRTTDRITGVEYLGFKGMCQDLQKLGMCHSRKTVEKFIPDMYLTASVKQRLELLAGLLDTDGCLRAKEHRYDYATTSAGIRDGIIALISSFGWRVSVKKQEPTTSSSGIKGRKFCYTISFNPTCYIPCRVKRKQLKNYSKQRKVTVRSIAPIHPVQGNCITVDGGEYCVGRHLIPTHNSTVGLWFDAWLGAKATVENLSAQSILAVGHSSSLVNTFYEEIGQFVEGDKYKFLEVFPELREQISYSAKHQTINFGEDKRYKTLSFRSADGSLAGGVEASLLLHIDDLIGGMEEALNPDRLEKKWQILYGDIRQRRKEGSKILYIGTIWSLLDPQVRFRELLSEDPNYRIKIIELPALDENDESNFDFKGGFSTAHYRSERAGMDEITWNCIYQQEPMEREGLIFMEDKFHIFSAADLIGRHPLSRSAFCDVAWGGKDFLSVPAMDEYEDGFYLTDAVFNRFKKDISQPIVAAKIKSWQTQSIIFEANNGGDEYADKIKSLISGLGYVCRISAKKSPNTPNAKLQRIVQFSPEIQKIHILSKKERSPEYQAFVSNILKFNQNGKNKNDDAPDSLALFFLYRANKPKPVTVLPGEYKLM